MFIQTDLCQFSERGLCTAKNTHRNFNELKVLELSKIYLEREKKIIK